MNDHEKVLAIADKIVDMTVQTLKAENEALRIENSALRVRLGVHREALERAHGFKPEAK